MKKRTLLAISMGGMLGMVTMGCGGDPSDPKNPGGAGNPGTGGNIGGAIVVDSKEKFVKGFLDIVCGPGNQEGALPQACGMSNDAAVNLYDCMFRLADFGNMGDHEGISDSFRMQLSSGPTALCTKLGTPGYSCPDFVGSTFRTAQYIGNIWEYSDPKPRDAEGLLGTCNIP